MAAESRLNGRVPPVFGAASGGPCAPRELAHNGLAPRGGCGRVSEFFSAALHGLCASRQVKQIRHRSFMRILCWPLRSPFRAPTGYSESRQGPPNWSQPQATGAFFAPDPESRETAHRGIPRGSFPDRGTNGSNVKHSTPRVLASRPQPRARNSRQSRTPSSSSHHVPLLI
jgi:hypothetical protein